ncbi:Crp/Fnr family transcriptional regulator [Olivibacter sp. CPCC 100613]|uniref:Crp/Fnr family transcriptional regulator n=1 Tax=Olivibacter sp. CPCC 100613 TaxID=3079931 RepID=UPI002FF9208C
MDSIKRLCGEPTCFLCNQVSNEVFKAISAKGTQGQIAKGQILFKEGDKTDTIYFITRGCVKTHMRWSGDREFILHFNKAGEVLGYRGMGGDLKYPISATALQKSHICSLSLDSFDRLLDVDPAFARKFLNFHINELRGAEKRMRDLALMEVKGRVANTIITLQEHFGCDALGFIAIEPKRQDLAYYAGTVYETFFRMLKQLEEESAVELKGKKIRILNKDQLLLYCTS